MEFGYCETAILTYTGRIAVQGSRYVWQAGTVATRWAINQGRKHLKIDYGNGLADFGNQMAQNEFDISKVNATSCLANTFVKNPLVSSAIGSGAEWSWDKGFNKSFILGNKKFDKFVGETSLGTIGNLAGDYMTKKHAFSGSPILDAYVYNMVNNFIINNTQRAIYGDDDKK